MNPPLPPQSHHLRSGWWTTTPQTNCRNVWETSFMDPFFRIIQTIPTTTTKEFSFISKRKPCDSIKVERWHCLTPKIHHPATKRKGRQKTEIPCLVAMMVMAQAGPYKVKCHISVSFGKTVIGSDSAPSACSLCTADAAATSLFVGEGQPGKIKQKRFFVSPDGVHDLSNRKICFSSRKGYLEFG